MSGFLSHLAWRTLGVGPVARARPVSRFAPAPFQGGASAIHLAEAGADAASSGASDRPGSVRNVEAPPSRHPVRTDPRILRESAPDSTDLRGADAPQRPSPGPEAVGLPSEKPESQAVGDRPNRFSRPSSREPRQAEPVSPIEPAEAIAHRTDPADRSAPRGRAARAAPRVARSPAVPPLVQGPGSVTSESAAPIVSSRAATQTRSEAGTGRDAPAQARREVHLPDPVDSHDQAVNRVPVRTSRRGESTAGEGAPDPVTVRPVRSAATDRDAVAAADRRAENPGQASASHPPQQSAARPTGLEARPAEPGSGDRTIEVTIGHIEVRATPPNAPPAPQPAAGLARVPSLADFLSRRGRR